MLVISRNIRGLGGREKKRMVRRLVQEQKPGILFPQETKLKSFDDRLVKSLGGSVLNRGMAMDTEGVSEVEDTIAWSFSSSSVFSVCSFKITLEELSTDEQDVFSMPWKGWCLLEIEIFAWQPLRGKVLVADILQRFDMGVDSVCKLCNKELETLNHTFIHCDWSWKVRLQGISWWGTVITPNWDVKG
ncbi:hypothetical protein Ddye_027078 [Dipteronia dyeriana]|uniref:Reverse transcriptase zinc-binding domain-containing protein n=1 Tax=Dipteronia dyeriana TaxID=168575 RepID=A0AAD9TNV3_9ROSI|nr:hypothetical protein Ddye_027078 [Dipteronia dyeriana]